MSVGARLRLPIAGAVLAAVVWRVGAGPFLDGLRTVDAPTLAAAIGLGALTTTCCAWRWRIVARGLGLELSLTSAVAACYRSQLLNVTLPGGVVGDVHRGVRHGSEADAVGLGLRAVAWERTAGQVVQAFLTLVVLVALPSPVGSALPLVAVAVGTAVVAVVLAARMRPGAHRSRRARLRAVVARDLRRGLLARRAWPGIALCSTLAVAGFVTTFLIAARTAGTPAPVSRLLPLAMVAMLVMVLPSIAGWGPREGATAWAFGAAGLGVERGIATAVVFGVMVLVASLPGAAVLVHHRLRRAPAMRSERPPTSALARQEEVVRG